MTAHARFRVLAYRHAAELLPADALGLNRSAASARCEFLALAPAGTRLPGDFLARCTRALDSRPEAQAVFPAAGPQREGPLSPAGLRRMNFVGPVFAVRRQAWLELGGLRPELRLGLWDFWLRLALGSAAPDRLLRLPGPPVPCPPLPRLASREEGRAKALLVVHTPGAFEPDACRWALALLRGEAWAAPFAPGLIPSPAEVRGLWAEAREAAFASRPLRRSA